MKYIIPGNPIPLARPRFSLRSTYDSQRLLKGNMRILVEHLHGTLPMYEGPLLLKIVFYLPIPKKSSKDNKLCNRFHVYKPDLSNLIKFIEDVGSGLLYHDDCLIARIEASKQYDFDPRTEFEIIQIDLSKE